VVFALSHKCVLVLMLMLLMLMQGWTLHLHFLSAICPPAHITINHQHGTIVQHHHHTTFSTPYPLPPIPTLLSRYQHSPTAT
jgi:hypothetical protein